MLSPFFVPIAVPLQWKWKKGSDHLGKGVLWNYGDSLMLYFHRSIRNANSFLRNVALPTPMSTLSTWSPRG